MRCTLEALIDRIIDQTANAIGQQAEHLCKLDRAIGDGDHGTNMKRGFEALVKRKAVIRELHFPDACKEAGRTLLMTIGGASGPLYSALLMGFGDASTQWPRSASDVSKMMRAGVEGIKRRGKSDLGDKTLLDVLIPLTDTIEAGGVESFSEARALAESAANDTKALVARKGRAAFLGERSRGHVDPGAQSASILVSAICQTLESA